MHYRRMPIEVRSPEQFGYGNIDCNLAESSVVTDGLISDLGINGWSGADVRRPLR